ncbi:hypothetical protein G9C98_006558 [Cotesia typhae]|uniref:Uncharacterized protein n=1 Tax=Cotesia typhae TaxID=2053667 RepID=A0A8J5QTA3_9HYME|nr:hypothetical protein G9C98_006558 [Cotesia typhae]
MSLELGYDRRKGNERVGVEQQQKRYSHVMGVCRVQALPWSARFRELVIQRIGPCETSHIVASCDNFQCKELDGVRGVINYRQQRYSAVQMIVDTFINLRKRIIKVNIKMGVLIASTKIAELVLEYGSVLSVVGIDLINK